MEGKTLIQISEKQKQELNKLKKYPRETYEEIVQRLLEGQNAD